MKLCKVEIFFVFLWLMVDGQVSPSSNTSALHIVTEKLATLSRVTNGIALQKELNSKSFNVDGLLAEILGMDSKEKGLVELVKIDVEGLKNDYEKIGNDAMAMKVSNLNESEVQSQLGVLGGMEKNVATLKEGIEWDTSEVLQNFTNAYGVKRTIFVVSIIEYATALEYFFTDDLSTVDTTKYEQSFQHLQKKTNEFKETCSQLLNFETDLKDLWILRESTEKFGAIEELATTADVYNISQNQLNALKTNIGEMQMEFGTIQPILKEVNKLSVSQVFDVLRGNFEQMNANVVSNRLLTPGFPAGTRDITALFKDLEGKWFRQELARNNETILKQMVSEFGSLKKVSENVALLEKSWKSVKSETELWRIVNGSVLWKEMIGRTIDESVFEQLSSSITKIGQCLQQLMPITAQVDSHAFHVILEKVRNLEFVSKTVHPLLKEISEIKILGNATVFKSFEKELIKSNTSSNSFVLQKIAAELKKNESYQELSRGAKQAGDLMSKILETRINEILLDSDHDWCGEFLLRQSGGEKIRDGNHPFRAIPELLVHRSTCGSAVEEVDWFSGFPR